MADGFSLGPARLWCRLPLCDRVAFAMRAVIGATALQWAMDGNSVWAVIGGTCLALSFLPDLLVRDGNLRPQTTLTLTGLMLAHVALGMEGGLYVRSDIYDKFAHGLGSGLIAVNLRVALAALSATRRLGPVLQTMMAFLAMTSIGVFWEVFEFTVDQTGLVSAQKSLADTMLDLIANSFGAAAALALLFLTPPRVFKLHY